MPWLARLRSFKRNILQRAAVERELADAEFGDTTLAEWWMGGALLVGVVVGVATIVLTFRIGRAGLILGVSAYAFYWLFMWWFGIAIWRPLLAELATVNTSYSRAVELRATVAGR